MNPLKRFTVASLAILGAVALYVTFLLHLLPDWSTRGTFGDSFGGLSSIFSGVALVGVIFALWMQSRELQLQREELELTRKELARSAAAQEASQEALRHQSEWLAMSTLLQQNPRTKLKGSEEDLDEHAWRASLAAQFAGVELGRLGVEAMSRQMARWKVDEVAEHELVEALAAHDITSSGDPAVDRQLLIDHISTIIGWGLERAVDLREGKIKLKDLEEEDEDEETPTNRGVL